MYRVIETVGVSECTDGLTKNIETIVISLCVTTVSAKDIHSANKSWLDGKFVKTLVVNSLM